MGRMTTEQENNKNYLKCILEEQEVIDEDCLAAISDEQASDGSQGITGIIPVIYSQVFKERILRYDVNAFLPFPEYKGYIATKEQIAGIFLSILEICRQADAYLLDLSYFLLEEQYIFVDRDTGKANLILYPVLSQEHSGQGDFRRLFSRMMQGIHLSDEHMGFYGTVMYELNQVESFSVVKFRELLLGKQTRQDAERMRNMPASPEEDAGIRTADRHIPGIVDKKPTSLPQEAPLPVQAPQSDNRDKTNKSDKPENADKAENSSRSDGKKGLFGVLYSLKEPRNKEERVKEERVKEERVKTPKKPKGGKASSGFYLDVPDGEVPVSEPVSQTPPPVVPDKHKPVRKSTVKEPSPVLKPAPVVKPVSEIPMTDDEDLDYGSTEDEIDGQPYIVLHYTNINEYITVKNFPFEIGREGKGYRIDASKTKVSRRHAEIIYTQDGFKICDCSKHGTWLNGTRLPKDIYCPLTNGAKLSLKGEEFTVNIYEG